MANQEVFFDETNLASFTGKPGEEIILPLKYKTSDGSSTPGIKLEIYYDSTLLTPVSVEDQLAASLISVNTFGDNLPDESNTDSDESTDKYIGFNWGDIMGLWAGGTDPVTLANIKFKIAEGADLSSAATSIRIESSETASGYNFYGQDLTLGASSQTVNIFELNLAENLQPISTFTANENVTWSIDGGDDSDKFVLDESTGELSFVSAPDFENAIDSDNSNDYVVNITSTFNPECKPIPEKLVSFFNVF